MTYPEIRDFFDRYVWDSQHLPIKEYYAKLGITLVEDAQGQPVRFEIDPNPTDEQRLLREAWLGRKPRGATCADRRSGVVAAEVAPPRRRGQGRAGARPRSRGRADRGCARPRAAGMTILVSASPRPCCSRNRSNDWRLSEQSVNAADCATIRASSDGGSSMQANGRRVRPASRTGPTGVKGRRSPEASPPGPGSAAPASGSWKRRCTAFQSSRQTARSVVDAAVHGGEVRGHERRVGPVQQPRRQAVMLRGDEDLPLVHRRACAKYGRE